MKLKLPSTGTVLYGLLATAIIWQLRVAADREHGNTISATVKKMAKDQPGITIAAGHLMGHFFAEQSFLFLGAFASSARDWQIFDKEDEVTP